MAETVKVAGCPGTTNVSETGWPVITAGSTAEGRREGGREGGYKRDYYKYAIQTVDLSNLTHSGTSVVHLLLSLV